MQPISRVYVGIVGDTEREEGIIVSVEGTGWSPVE